MPGGASPGWCSGIASASAGWNFGATPGGAEPRMVLSAGLKAVPQPRIERRPPSSSSAAEASQERGATARLDLGCAGSGARSRREDHVARPAPTVITSRWRSVAFLDGASPLTATPALPALRIQHSPASKPACRMKRQYAFALDAGHRSAAPSRCWIAPCTGTVSTLPSSRRTSSFAAHRSDTASLTAEGGW